MFDLKDTAVLMCEATTCISHFTWDSFGEVNVL